MKFRHRSDDRGAVAVIVAVFTVVMFALAALVVDLGIARDTRLQAQATADAAALAGANSLYAVDDAGIDKAIDEVMKYASRNLGITPEEWEDCVDNRPLPYVAPNHACISFDSATDPRRVRVAVPPQRTPALLGNAFGFAGLDISAFAVAEVVPAADTGVDAACVLCVLGNETHDTGDADVSVAGGDVHIKGSHQLSEDGSLTAADGEIRVEGTLGGFQDNYFPAPELGPFDPPIEDPLRSIAMPSQDGLDPKPGGDYICGGGPGIYPNVEIEDSCDLSAGLYVITGNLEIMDEAAVSGVGVTLFFTTGELSNTSDGDVALSAPTGEFDPLRGLLIVYDRDNLSDMRLTGNGVTTLTGVVYGAGARLDLRGNGCAGSITSMVVVGDLFADSEAPCWDLTYDSELAVGPQNGEIALIAMPEQP